MLINPRHLTQIFFVCLALLSASAPAVGPLLIAKDGSQLSSSASHVIITSNGRSARLIVTTNLLDYTPELAVVFAWPRDVDPTSVQLIDFQLVEMMHTNTALMLEEDKASRSKRKIAGAMGAAPGGDMLDHTPLPIEGRFSSTAGKIAELSDNTADGVRAWLSENGYTLSEAAAAALDKAEQNGRRFSVVDTVLSSVNTKLIAEGGLLLTPIQADISSPELLLPMELAMANVEESRDLTIYSITKTGATQTIHQKNVEMPENLELPEYILRDLPRFRDDLRQHRADRESGLAVFKEFYVEAAPDMALGAELVDIGIELRQPVSANEFRQLGAEWMTPESAEKHRAQITRLHTRITPENAPDSIGLKEEFGHQSYHALFQLKDWWGVKSDDPVAMKYRSEFRQKQMRQVHNLETLTGWLQDDILLEKFPGEVTEAEIEIANKEKLVEEATQEFEAEAAQARAAAEAKRIPTSYILFAILGMVICVAIVMVSAAKKRDIANAAIPGDDDQTPGPGQSS